MTSFRGENPTVRCSGSSENALRNPSVFFCRKSRIMKASVDCGVILEGRLVRFRVYFKVQDTLLCMKNNDSADELHRDLRK
jgi:hypothetical protein